MSLPQNQSQALLGHITANPLQTTGGGITEFEMQVMMIADENKFEYQSPADLFGKIQTTLDSESAEEYFLYFSGVTHDHLPEIDEEFHATHLRCTLLFTTENRLSGLICRILTGTRHKDISLNLEFEIQHKITSIPGITRDAIRSFDLTRFNIANVRSKEGHKALRPATREARGAWPSVVIEIGYSEALDFLRLDAKWWLINSAGKSRFVILVQLLTDPVAIHIECWTMVASDDQQMTQAQTESPTGVQVFDIDDAGTVASASPELRIPYSCIFDDANENATDVIFTNAELSSFAVRMFTLMERKARILAGMPIRSGTTSLGWYPDIHAWGYMARG